jgi:hypothetical protein
MIDCSFKQDFSKNFVIKYNKKAINLGDEQTVNLIVFNSKKNHIRIFKNE